MALLSVQFGDAHVSWSDQADDMRFPFRLEVLGLRNGQIIELTPDQFEAMGAVMTRLHEMFMTRNMKIRSE